MQPDGNEPRKPPKSPDIPEPILAPATIVSTPAPRIPRRKRCEEKDCEIVFERKRSTARFCAAHRKGRSANARYRAKLAEDTCSSCNRAAEIVKDDKPYCRGCDEERRRDLILDERARTASKKAPPGWETMNDDDLAALVSRDPKEAMHGTNWKLEAIATAWLARAASPTAYPVNGIDAGSEDVMTKRPLSITPDASIMRRGKDGERFEIVPDELQNGLHGYLVA